MIDVVKRYGAALVLTVLALGLTLWLENLLRPSVFTFFFIAVTLSAWYGGLWPGLLSSLVSVVAANFLFLAPVSPVALGPDDLARLSPLLVATVLVSSLTGSLRRAREEALAHAAEARAAAAQSERTARDVEEQAAELEQHVEQLQALAADNERLLEETQQELARRTAAEEHYRRLVETSPDGIYVLDAQGRISESNPALAAILGRRPAELVGMHYSELLPPEERDRAEINFHERRNERGIREFEYHAMRPSGERRVLRVRSTPIHEDGEYRGSHAVVRDVTDQVARDELLRRTERLASLGTMLAGVAHELNNPLHAIRSFAELMLLDARSPRDRESLEIVRREADRAAKVVADLRLIARETQEAKSRRLPVDLNDVVRHILKIRRYSLETGNVEIREDLARDLPPVLANRGEIEQVVLNLVVNAEHAMAEQEQPRKLVLRTRRIPGGASVNIVDSGPGIPSQHLERVFDPFFTTKAPGEGTGLGLSLVHSIVTEHGGEIHVDSEPGKGTTIRIDLPRADNHEPSAPESAVPEPARALRILVVDDEAAIRRVVVLFLERLGHRVDTAAEGEEALRLLDEREYDLILSDLRMPGLGGDELFRRLRARGDGLERRLIFVTGDAASEQAARVISEARVPVLLKPVRLQDLARTVESAARERPAT